jgi:hypothetical protein
MNKNKLAQKTLDELRAMSAGIPTLPIPDPFNPYPRPLDTAMGRQDRLDISRRIARKYFDEVVTAESPQPGYYNVSRDWKRAKAQGLTQLFVDDEQEVINTGEWTYDPDTIKARVREWHQRIREETREYLNED